MAKIFEHTTYNERGDIVSETHGNATVVRDTRTNNQIKNANYIENKTTLNRELGGIFTAVKVVVAILLLVLLVRAMTINDYQVPKFTDLLEFVAGTNDDSLINGSSLLIDFIKPIGEWSYFDELRQFLNLFINLFNVTIFLANGIISALQYIVVFVIWIFGL